MKPFARAGCVHREAGKRRRAGLGKTLIAGAAVAAVFAIAAVPASAEVEAGRNLELNHSIQLGVLEEWAVGDNVLVEVRRGATIDPATHAVSGGTLIASHEATFTNANINSKGGTTYDINHIGPGADAIFGKSDCWDTAGGGTPDIKPGDLMVATLLDGPGGNPTSDIDYVFIRNVIFEENPATGKISGHARGVETAGVFDVEAAVVLSGDPEGGGSLAMEAKRVGSDVEADFGFLPEHIAADGTFTDVEVGGTPGQGELFIDTLDLTGGGTGNTVTFRSSEPAEDTGCGALQTTAFTSNTHDVINLANVGTDMVVGGPKEAAVAVTATFNGAPLTVVENAAAGTWSATIPTAVLQALADGSTSELVVSFDDGSPNQTASILKDVTAPVLSASPPSGTYTGTTGVALSSNGGEVVRFTQDGSVPSGTSRLYDGTPVALAPGSHTIRAFSVDAAGNRSDATFSYTINPPAGAAGGGGGAGGVAGAGGAGAGGAAGGGTAGDVLARITGLRAIRLTLAQARRRGVLVSFNVPNGARFVRVTLFRQTNAARHNTRRLVVRRTFAVSRSGRHTFRINDRRTRRKLQRGKYVIQVAPGVSDSSFQEATARRFTIR